MPTLVRCNKIDDQCPDKCVHKIPHRPIYDLYSYKDHEEDMESYCDEEESECWYVNPKRWTKCIEEEK